MSPRLAALYAHPDDDAFSIGGSIALRAGKDLDLLVVYATSGEAGPIADPSLATRETLGRIREEEARAALEILGAEAADVHFLRYPDSGLARVPHEELESRLVELLVAFRPDVVATFGPEGVTKHSDHITIHQAATAAFHQAQSRSDDGFARLLYTAIPENDIRRWQELMREAGVEPFNPDDPYKPRGVPDETIAVRVDCREVLRQKVESIRAHRTQASEYEGIPEEAYPIVFGTECFTLAYPARHESHAVLSDLFEALDQG